MIDKKLGYYHVENLEFDSKIKACIYANKHNKEVRWDFNDSFFEKYPWHVEPSLSLDELYDLRARQLRETYDYVIISYSGGADSHNIVSSFIRQGLHIDEIVVNTMETITNKFTLFDPTVKNPENAAAEHKLQTLPRLKEIEKRCPTTKISILDLSDYLLSSWLKVGDASWVLDKREGLNPLNVTRFNYIHFNKIRKQFDKNKKIGLILGVEKPRTLIGKKNRFYLQFSDRAANIITIENHIKEYTNATVEYFYWSPDSANILAKQAHVIKRWVEQDETRRNLWHWKTNNNPKIFRHIHERILRTLIYTTWNNTWYQADKATKDWYSEFDSWFIEGFKGSFQHSIWQEGISYVETNASKYVNKTGDLSDGLQVFLKHYYIGEMKSPPIND